MAVVFDITCGIPLQASQNHFSCCLSPSFAGASLRRVSEKKRETRLHVSTSLKQNFDNARQD